MKYIVATTLFCFFSLVAFSQTYGKYFADLPTMTVVDGTTYFVTLDGTPKVWKKFNGNTLRTYVNSTVTSVTNLTALNAISAPYEGDLAVNTARDTLWIRATSTWIVFKAGTGGGGSTPNLQSVLAVGNSANSLKITNLATPTTGTDAANKTYVDTQISGVSDAANLYSINVANLARDTAIARSQRTLRDSLARAGWVSTTDLAINSVSTIKIQNAAIDSTKAGNLAPSDFNTSGATVGNVLTVTASGAKYRTPIGGAPSGSAGGDLIGTYPNPTIANNSIISAYVLDGTLVNADLAGQTIDSNKVKNRAIPGLKIALSTIDSTRVSKVSPNNIAQNGATAGQALVWDAVKGAYAPRAVSGGSGITALTGDITASGTGSVTATIANSAVTGAKIATGTIASSNILDGTIDAVDLATNSVSTIKIQDVAVTTSKLATNAVDSTKATNLALSNIAQSGASIGFIPKWTASGYKPRPDDNGIISALPNGDVNIVGQTSSDLRIQNTRVQFDNKFKIGSDSAFQFNPSTKEFVMPDTILRGYYSAPYRFLQVKAGLKLGNRGDNISAIDFFSANSFLGNSDWTMANFGSQFQFCASGCGSAILRLFNTGDFVFGTLRYQSNNLTATPITDVVLNPGGIVQLYGNAYSFPKTGQIVNSGVKNTMTFTGNGTNLTAVFEQNQAVQTSSVTVANTTSETALTSASLLTIPANTLTVGRTIRIRASGFYSVSVGSSFSINTKLGSTIIDSDGTITLSTVTNQPWEYETEITIRSVGASGTSFSQGKTTYWTASTTPIVFNSPTTATTTINTTTSNALTINAVWVTANAGNTITCTNATIQLIN